MWNLIALGIVASTLLIGCTTTGTTQAQPAAMPQSSIHNLYRVTDRLYSGAAPESDADFAALAELGVKTVITVDGAKPDAGTAAKHGIRYVHLPIGYDGIGDGQAVRIVKTARDLPGPLYIHCHHGKHRGPTAAAICAVALDGWTNEQAVAWMRRAGTADAYRGLYVTARRFTPPSKAALDAMPDNLPAAAKTPPMVDAMVDVDERFEHLTAVRDAGWRPPTERPDIDPAHEALLLHEGFAELARMHAAAERGADFTTEMTEVVAATEDLHKLLALLKADGSLQPEPLADAYNRVARNCTSCHTKFRN